MLKKALTLEIKALDAATGIVRAYVASFGNIDRVGDIIVRGAFLKTIPGFLADGVVLWNHNTDCPIGSPLDAGEDEKGLWVEFQLDLEVEKAKEIFQLMKSKVIKKFSIGYDVRSRVWLTGENMSSYAPANASAHEIALALNYGAALLEIELYEISPVSIPANNNTGIESLKAVKAKALAELEPTPEKPEVSTQVDNAPAAKPEPATTAPDAKATLARIKLAQMKRRASLRSFPGA